MKDELDDAFGLDGDDLGPKPNSTVSKEPKDYIKDEDERDLFGDDLPMGDGMGEDFAGDGGGIAPLEKHKDLLRDLTNFDPYLRETVNNWLGLAWDEEQGKPVKNPYIKPLMNMQGASWCIGFLKTYARSNNIITDIGAQSYKWKMMDVIDTIWLGLGTRAADFEIHKSSDLLRVCNELQHAIELVLEGAEGGRYNKFLGTTYTHHSNDSGMGAMGNAPVREEKDKGFVGKLKKGFFGVSKV